MFKVHLRPTGINENSAWGNAGRSSRKYELSKHNYAILAFFLSLEYFKIHRIVDFREKEKEEVEERRRQRRAANKGSSNNKGGGGARKL